MPVNRGPSLASCSAAIAAAVIADGAAREQRAEAAQRLSEEAFREVTRGPDRIAWGGSQKGGRRSP